MNPSPEVFGSTIVVVGRFNPAIFTPDWLEARQLVGSGDADAARASSALLITAEFAIIETDWFRLAVQDSRFSLESRGVLTPALRDLAVGALSIVQHTPVTALGMNFLSHWKMPSIAEYHAVGDSLAPKAIWTEVFPGRAAGLEDLTIKLQTGKRDQEAVSPDELRIQVQPSAKVKHGIYLTMNDHREAFAKQKGSDNALAAAEIIKSEWQSTWELAMTSFEAILEKSRQTA